MYPIYVPIYLSMYLYILSGVKTEQPNLPKMDPKIIQKVVPRRKTSGPQVAPGRKKSPLDDSMHGDKIIYVFVIYKRVGVASEALWAEVLFTTYISFLYKLYSC